MTRFKICGLREVGHVLAAADAGADFLGFVFVPGVRRQLSVEAARGVIQEYRRPRGPGGPKLVGLFADQSPEEVNRTVRECALDIAQLCGDESSDYWRRIDAPIIRQIKVRAQPTNGEASARVMAEVEEVTGHGHIPLLDSHEAGSLGGTGRSFDWTIAREVAVRHEVMLAGGLTPDNVDEAISIAQPWAVDVSSGVETEGVKDEAKIKTFAQAVRASERG